MAKFMGWDEAAESGGGNSGGGGSSGFLRLKAGNEYRVRLISKPIRYLQHWEPVICRSPGVVDDQVVDPLIELGYQPKPRYAIWVLDRNDNNRLKVMDFPQTLLSEFREWKNNFNAEPGGKEGPDFKIKVEVPGGGNRRFTKYKAMALDRTPFTDEEMAAIKDGDLKNKLAEYRRDHTPEEIRAMLAEKKGEAASATKAVQSETTEQPAAASTAVKDDEMDF